MLVNSLFSDSSALEVPESTPSPSPGGPLDPPRLRRPDRQQVVMLACCPDELLPPDHLARTVWAVVERWDLARLYDAIRARGETPGRAATEPRLLVALWLYATMDGVLHGRELARLCAAHDAYKWLCGGVHVNDHLLNDFRTAHQAVLDQIFTDVLATLTRQGVVQIDRTSQDGLRVRASAGADSFRRRPRLEQCLGEARQYMEEVRRQAAESPDQLSRRRQAARERAAVERVKRVEAALAEMSKLEEIKSAQRDDKPSKQHEPRASMTDPDARRMKMANGGFNPAYNVQVATDVASGAIVAIDVTSRGVDTDQDQVLRDQIERRTGRRPREHLLDGGYVTREAIERAAHEGVQVYAPLPRTGKQGAVCTYRPGDPPGVAAWRARMSSADGKTVYKQRAATSERTNAELRTLRGLTSLSVRGLQKVRSVALWSALACNVAHFADYLLRTS